MRLRRSFYPSVERVGQSGPLCIIPFRGGYMSQSRIQKCAFLGILASIIFGRLVA
jgi:hypothetical protein